MSHTPDDKEGHASSPPSDASSNDNQSAKAIAAGWVLGGALIVGVLGGMAIDDWRQTSPFWTVCLALLFMVAGFYQVIKDNIR